MSFKNRYFKNPVGVNNNFSFIGIVGQVEYSAQANFGNFVANSVAGEVGIYNANTNALISGLSAVNVNTEIFIALNIGVHPKDGKAVIKTSERFRVSELKMTRTPYLAPVKGATAFAFDAGTAVVAKDEIGVKILDLTIAGNPINGFDFSVVVKTGETFDAAMQRLTDQINDTAGILLRDRDQLVTASYVAGTNTLTITNVKNGDIVKVLLQGVLADKTVTTTVTKTVEGSGTVEDVKLWEEAQFIREGVTTNYPDNSMANPEDFGKPNSLIVANGQYNHYTFQKVNSDISKTNRKIDYYPTTMELIVASNGAANAEAEIKAIFGL